MVSFDADGLLLSLSTGIVVGSGEHDGAGGGGGLAAQIDEEERRVVAQEAKLESLKSQEGRAAYEKASPSTGPSAAAAAALFTADSTWCLQMAGQGDAAVDAAAAC